MRLEVQTALIGAFVSVAVMTGMLLRRRRRRTDILFAVLCVVLLTWFLAAFLRGSYGTDPWLRVELGIAALVPAATIRLFSELVPWASAKARRFMSVAYPLSGLAAILALSPLGGIEAVQVAIGAYVALAILFTSRQTMEASEPTRGTVEEARRRYLAYGVALVTTLAILGEIPQLRGTLTAVGHSAVMLYVFLLSQVILRERLLDLNEFFARMVILGILAVLFAGISAVLVSLGNNASSRLFNAVVGVIVLLTLYEPLKDRLEARATELFFRERHRFVSMLEDLRRRMQHGVIDPARMSQIVVDALHDARRATHVAIYLLEPMGSGLVRHAHRGPEPASRVNANEHPGLWQLIQQNRAPILVENLIRSANGPDEDRRELISALREVSADVLLPFVSGDTVLGFLALRDDRTVEPYSTQEIAALMKIAETAATVIWNSKLAERHRERERLATIGAMAAGLAHEIRNPLGSIKGAAEYLDPKSFQAQEAGEFLQVIIDETNRLNSVVSQFLDYARPFRANLQPTHLNSVIQKTAKLLEAEKTDPVPLVLELDERMPEISADSEQLKQVVLNMILNGRDAMKGREGVITLRTRYLEERGLIELRVRDRGCGIPAEDLDKVFIPFFTTKQHGTGLGLAVCQRIVANHGGTIQVDSRVGEGTEFVIQLPSQQRDLVSTTGSFVRPRFASRVPDERTDPRAVPDPSKAS